LWRFPDRWCFRRRIRRDDVVGDRFDWRADRWPRANIAFPSRSAKKASCIRRPAAAAAHLHGKRTGGDFFDCAVSCRLDKVVCRAALWRRECKTMTKAPGDDGMSNPTTRIGTPTSDTDRFRMRGKDVLSEILGEKTFTEAFYFIVTGRELTPGQVKIFDSALIILMDHGITPMALVARLVENAVPTDIQVPVAAGIMMVGNRFAGTMAGCGQILQDCMAQDGDKRAWLAAKADDYRAHKRFMPGFGHPYYKPEDPRAARLFEIARANGAKGTISISSRSAARRWTGPRGVI